MELQALYIKAFGGLKDYSLKFQPGAMLFYGPNERGKTTVLTFIRAMFYGLGERRGLDSLRERYTPRDGSAMAGNLWFRHEGTNFELSRTFGARKGLDQVTLTDLDRNRYLELADAEQPGRWLFGLTQEVFANSVFVEPQGPKLQNTPDTRRELWETLSDFMVSSDDKVTTAEVQERLQKARLHLRSANGKKGEIPAVAQRVATLDREVQDLSDCQDEEARLTTELDRLHGRLAELEQRESELETDIMVYEYLEDLDRLRLATEPEEHRRTLEARNTALETDLQGLGANPKLREKRLAQLKMITSQLTDAAKTRALEAREEARRRDLLTQILRTAGLVLAALAIILGAAIFITSGPTPQIPLLITAGVLLAAGLGLYFGSAALAKAASTQSPLDLEESAARQAERLRELYQILPALGFDRTEQKLATAAGQSNETTLQELEQIQTFLGGLETKLQEQSLLERQIADLGERSRRITETLGDPQAYRERLAETREALLASGRNPDDEKLDFAQENLISAELRDVRAEIAKLNRQEAETRVHLQSLLHDPRTGAPVSPAAKLAEVSRELQEARAHFQKLRLRHEALELAESTLAGNLLELREKLLPRLAENAGRYMQQLSRGHYDSLIVNENLEIMLRDSTSGHYYSPEHFSTGTSDQLWFSFRLALTDYLGAGQGLPLLLDDLFMNFDDKRAAAGLALLAAKAQDGQQVLLLTCHKRVHKLAEENPAWSCRTMP